jgi:hypothetical protein
MNLKLEIGKTMAQSEFTKEEARLTAEAFREVFNALPKSKLPNFIGHANDIYLFLAAAEKAAPDQKSQED